MPLTITAGQVPAMEARKLVPHRFREVTADARGWLEDCYGKSLPDGRTVQVLGAIDVWLLLACNYEGGVVQFIEDGQYIFTQDQLDRMVNW